MAKTIDASALTKAEADTNIPIYLVEIALDSATLRFAENNEDIVFPTGGNTYTAWDIEFGRVVNKLTNEIDRIDFNFDNTDLSMSTYLASNVFQGKILTLKRVFADLLGSADYATIVFAGEIGGITVDESFFSCTVLSHLVKMGNLIPSRLYQPNCTWDFGGTECDATTGVLTAQTADADCTTILIKDAARTEDDDHWRDGIIEFTTGDLDGEKRIINKSASGEITVITPFSDSASAADQYTIIRGCTKIPTDCIGKFDNWINFGGFVAVPQKEVYL